VPAAGADHIVTANPDFSFTPNTLGIAAGDTVTFRNAGGYHNVAIDMGGGTTLRCAQGCQGQGGTGAATAEPWSATVRFPRAGTFAYQCDIHVADGMVGSITVASSATLRLGGYLSGNWYVPDQGGHGFQLEFTNHVNASGKPDMLAIWFVYAPAGASSDGAQNWIYAEGDYDVGSSTVTLPARLLVGAKFPPNFNASDVQGISTGNGSSWGTMSFSFNDCNNGEVSWHSSVPGYDRANDMPLKIRRLTQIAGTTCPN
jgi:plastocyanin